MKIFVVGSGKLANALLSSKMSFQGCELLKWETESHTLDQKAIVVHAGSGRQLMECVAFCERTDSILIELSTGLETEKMEPQFTTIICPNTSILLLKTLNLIKSLGHYFEHYKISITESHQSSKKSVPGTAFSFADSLRFPVDQIRSLREPAVQLTEINIPSEYLDKHAYHKIVIEDGLDQITLETKVLGHHSYAMGVQKIIDAVLKHSFEKRKYSVFELIDQNMI